MKLHNFKTIFPLAHTLYGVHIDSDTAEEMALVGLELIGNKHTHLYRYVCDTINCRIQLPCNAASIESVHLPLLDAEVYSSAASGPIVENIHAEHYIEGQKHFKDPRYTSGKLAHYREEGDELVFDRDYKNVTVVYHGVIVDEDGLPLITDKEMKALAAYLAYSDLYKQGLLRRDGGLLQMSMLPKADWLKLCTAARIPERLSQNDMNDILDIKTKWDRKRYGKSFMATC